MNRAVQHEAFEALKTGIDKGVVDPADIRVKDFDTARIIERGRSISATR